MKIQKPRRFTKADYPDAPDWMDNIFQVLNIQFERLVTLLQNNVTFQDNLRAEVRSFEVQDDTSTAIRLQQLQRIPLGVIVLNPGNFDHYKYTWEPAQQDLTINFKIKFDTAPATNPTVTLLIIGS